MYLLSNCAACAAPLALDAPRCVRCLTRYCHATCQQDHWRRGHKQMCKKIHRGGGAEQYYADKKYKEAVAEAVEACADDAKGQTCYICTQSVHWKTKEGLVRMCACRGTAGFAHLSCLAEKAKILFAEAEENNLARRLLLEKWQAWENCSLCKQRHHGVVACALGWACWKTYLGRPDLLSGGIGKIIMINLVGSLRAINRDEDALAVCASLADTLRSVTDEGGADLRADEQLIHCLDILADCNEELGRPEEIALRREIFDKTVNLRGWEDEETYEAALSLGAALLKHCHVRTARRFSEEIIVCADEHLDGHNINFRLDLFYLRSVWLQHFYGDEGYREYLREAVLGLVQLLQQSYQALGPTHDTYREIKNTLHDALSYQLDWSLDDLELDSTDRQIVDRVLADLPAPDFEIELNDRLRTVIIT